MADISEESFAKEEEGEGKKKKGDAMENGSMQSYRGHVCYCRSTFQDCIDPFFVPVSFPLVSAIKKRRGKKRTI